MTRTSVVDSEPLTIRVRLVWSLSSARCLWDLMKAGTRFSLTCPISRGEPTVRTTLRHSGTFHSTSIYLNWGITLLLFCNDYWLHNALCRVQIHANCRIRRIYFSDRLYTEDELPPEFKLFLPVAGKPQGGQQIWTWSASAHQSRLGWKIIRSITALSIGWGLKTHAQVFVMCNKTSLSSWRRPPDLCRVQISKAHPHGLNLRDSPWQRSPKEIVISPNQNT